MIKNYKKKLMVAIQAALVCGSMAYMPATAKDTDKSEKAVLPASNPKITQLIAVLEQLSDPATANVAATLAALKVKAGKATPVASGQSPERI